MNRLLSRSSSLQGTLSSVLRRSAVARLYSATKQPPHPAESFLRPASANYVEQMYIEWKANPKSVHSSWDAYFRNVASGLGPAEAFQAPPTLRAPGTVSSFTPSAVEGADALQNITDHLKVQLLVRAYQVRAHHIAALDPLGILSPDLSGDIPKELLLETYGFTEKDLKRKFNVATVGQMTGILGNEGVLTLEEIIEKIKTIYCGKIGFEYMHIESREECNWIRERIENIPVFQYSKEDKKVILDRLLWADLFENFVAKKWKSEKRFGLEGCESLIPGIKSLIDYAADLGTRNIVIGMPHRGRLNVLANVVRKPLEAIFSEFSGTTDYSDSFSGDVKYHLGMSFDRPTRNGKRIHLSLVANPSHLEAVNPVVMGKARGMQYFTNDTDRIKTVPVLLHGDAAFAGQGVVYESMGLTDLPNYTTGGVVHLIVNNQIGFTTDPRFSRSTPYCSDIAKSFQAPVFHVNSDDPEAVVFACNLAMEFRNTFKKDAVVDLICYRKHGHNEIDQPAFTQPLMYKKIGQHEPILNQYIKKLVAEGTVTQQEVDDMKKAVDQILEDCYNKSKNYKSTMHGWTSSTWMTETSLPTLEQLSKTVTKIHYTGVPKSHLQGIGKVISGYPEDFNVHSGLQKILKAKAKTIEDGEGIDMPTAEGLAFGSLLSEGYHIRLSGQDVERGTFSHRHAVLHDQEVDKKTYLALNNLSSNGIVQKEKITICNSHLSEYAVMGFELGYSLVNPNSLVLWEAQFGDFANTAQTIIDQFIASGETKWLQRTGLVLLLPHGYDGAGPEHSSGRLERFLQLCNDHPERIPKMSEDERRQIQDSNMQVVYPSTPANYFHVLRRQVHRDFRKPLVVFNSKSLLRHPLSRSSIDEMSEGTRFHRFIPDRQVKNPHEITRLVLCSGQVYYTLLQAKEEQKLQNVALSRVEQISPFPFDRVIQEADKYPNAKVVWAQEEPMNAGAWSYVQPRIITSLKASQYHGNANVSYAGREPSASTATGNKKQHIYEEKDLVSQAFHGVPASKK